MRIKNVHSLHRVSASFLLPFCRILCRDKTISYQCVVGHRVLQCHKHLLGILVFALFKQLSGIVEHVVLIGFAISHSVGIGSRSSHTLVYLCITTSLFQSYFAAFAAFFSRNHPESLFVLVACVVVFAHGKILLSFLQCVSHTARAEQYYK